MGLKSLTQLIKSKFFNLFKNKIILIKLNLMVTKHFRNISVLMVLKKMISFNKNVKLKEKLMKALRALT